MNLLDIFLAVLVLIAVVAFGAMQVLGSERQRRAIQAIADQAGRWAEQDLQLKRARVAKEVRVDDPRLWLERIAAQTFGASPSLTALEPWQGGEGALAIVGSCQDGRRLVVTPLPMERFRQAVQARKARGRGASALRRAEGSILGARPGRVPVYELTLVTAGAFFDVEAAQVWKALHGRELVADRLYLFEVPASRAR